MFLDRFFRTYIVILIFLYYISSIIKNRDINIHIKNFTSKSKFTI